MFAIQGVLANFRKRLRSEIFYVYLVVMNMENKKDPEKCPYCGQKMKKWVASPESSWGPRPQLVCFNDECPYYVKGWEWMKTQFQQNVSYRYRYNPETGESGPLPVFSPDALKSGIIE
jgi:hypothetical protein